LKLRPHYENSSPDEHQYDRYGDKCFPRRFFERGSCRILGVWRGVCHRGSLYIRIELMRRRMSRRDQKGQAVIEYILMLVAALAIIGIVSAAFKRIRDYLWMQMLCEVPAACIGC